MEVVLGGVDAGADGGGTHVHRVELVLERADADSVPLHHGSVGVEALPQPHRYGILELGATHLQDGIKLMGLGDELVGETLQVLLQGL